MHINILYVSPTSPRAVRTSKFLQYFHTKGFKVSFLGWSRKAKLQDKDANIDNEKYILRGGGSSTKILPFLYCCFVFKLFFTILFRKNLKEEIVFVVNFESGFAVWLASKFRKVRYVYDIWDELAISHNFSPFIKRLIRSIDKRIRRDSYFYIHVDSNRLSEIDSSNYVIIFNSPYDYFNGLEREVEYKKEFAVTGYLNDGRGLNSIMLFAKDNPDYKFIVVGEFLNKNTEQEYLSIANIEYHHFLPQSQLFELIQNCRGIFSLYDTHIPIYRLAASNKLYDAMMLSIPVIVNKEVLAASFVNTKKIGYVVNYEYDETWRKLVEALDEEISSLGSSGRKCYCEEFEFSSLLDRELLPKLS